jgi:GAF domain-containing protein
MAEDLYIPKGVAREEIYASTLPQIKALVKGESDSTANVANIMAALKEAFGFFWVGCYFVKNDQLVLGPFQGPVACTRIFKGKGVCGASWEKNEVILVPDVDAFPGHIACSSLSKSEIVLPIRNTNGEVVGVLDVDSDQLDDFSETDHKWLIEVVAVIESVL